jgi:hypothetical protein
VKPAEYSESIAVPVPRRPGLDFNAPIPRYWFADNAVATHLANGVNLLFPAGERFFVRSVKYYVDRIEDPGLRARVKGFFGQEGHHSREHEHQFQQLIAQGFDVDSFLRLYEAVAYGFIERLAPPQLSLSTTAACEHFTAIMAEDALRIRVLDLAHPTMRALLLWHSAEEIEHRAVAYDVLQAVNPSYALRVSGLAMATLTLSGFWTIGTSTLLWQDRKVGARRLLSDWRKLRQRRRQDSVFGRGIREYLRRDFHPSQKPMDKLAFDYLASAGLA